MTGTRSRREPSQVLLEVCIDDAAGLAAAIAGGADRIELCSALALGGLTPTPGLIELARGCPVPVYAMIRPRAGDFVFGPADLSSMQADIDHVADAGLDGVVLGASRADGRLDETVLSTLCERAGGLGMTLHRAFDLVPDFIEGVDCAIDLGFERILTSGGRPTAIEGLDALEEIVDHARGRIAIMPGSGVKPGNVAELLRRLAVREVHASGSSPRRGAGGRLLSLGFEREGDRATNEATIAELKRSIETATMGRSDR